MMSSNYLEGQNFPFAPNNHYGFIFLRILPSTIVFKLKWAPSSEFVSSSIPSWQILNAHAKPFRGARDLAFCLKVPLDSLLVWASSGGSGETARMRRLAWTFAARIGDKNQICLTRSKYGLVYQFYAIKNIYIFGQEMIGSAPTIRHHARESSYTGCKTTFPCNSQSHGNTCRVRKKLNSWDIGSLTTNYHDISR